MQWIKYNNMNNMSEWVVYVKMYKFEWRDIKVWMHDNFEWNYRCGGLTSDDNCSTWYQNLFLGGQYELQG